VDNELLGEDVKARYADLKKAAADRCPRLLGTFVKTPEVQYHHGIYNHPVEYVLIVMELGDQRSGYRACDSKFNAHARTPKPQ
jgi:hypothetical protein